MSSFWIRRSVASDFPVGDLGIIVRASSERDLAQSFDTQTLAQSADLAAALTGGALARIDGPGGAVIPAADAFDDNDLAQHIAEAFAHHPHANKAVIDAITSAGSGVIISASERSKLGGIEAGAEVNDTGAEIVTKLQGEPAPLALNVASVQGASAAQLRDRATHTGTQTASTISDFATAADARITAKYDQPNGIPQADGTGLLPTSKVLNFASEVDGRIGLQKNVANGVLGLDGSGNAVPPGLVDGRDLAADGTKLDGIEAGAEANDTGAEILTKLQGEPAPLALNVTQVGGATAAQLRDRATHTGTQLASTISDFNTAADARIAAQKGVAGGLATLDAGGKVPVAQIPATALPQVYVVANTAARLALTVQEGDEAIQIDDGSHWIYDGSAWYSRPNGTGDVTGPASATDSAVVLFDGTTGKIVKNSATLLSALAPTTRQIVSGAGLTGGGDLSADRTLNVGAHPDGSIIANADNVQVGVLATDAQHGSRGGGTQHAAATPSVAGFMSASDKTKLDGLPTSAVPTSRTLTAGAGLTGGGDLTANRTFNVAANADGSIVVNADDVQVGVLATDAQHGSRGGGTQHAAATTSVNGFMSAADKSKLDGYPLTPPVSADGSIDTHSDVDTTGKAVDDTLRWNGSNWVPQALPTGNLPSVQTRRTTSLLLTGSFVNLTLDTDDVENNTAVIEHDNVNTERVLIKETGLYFVTASAVLDCESSTTVEIRTTINGSTEIAGSLKAAGAPAFLGLTQLVVAPVVVLLTAGQYVTAQARRSAGTNNITLTQATLIVTSARGVKGDKGDTGIGSNVEVRNNGSVLGNFSSLNFQPGLVASDAGGGVANIVSVYGTQHTEVESLGESTTTSTTFQNKLTLTTPSVPAGRYRVGWSFTWRYSNGSNDLRARILEDGSTTRWEMRQEPQDTGSDQQHPADGFAYINLTAGVHNFNLEYCGSTGGSTAGISQARLEFWRVS